MGMQGDFFQLLKEQGYTLGGSTAVGAGHALTNATTILAFKYRDGVLVAGDRRATAGNMDVRSHGQGVGDRSVQCDGNCRGPGDRL